MSYPCMLLRLAAVALAISACGGAALPTPTPSPSPSSTPSASPTPAPTPTPTPGPCAGAWVGVWRQVFFETNTGGIRLPTYSVTGKQLTLNEDCSYVEDWSQEASDIGCQSHGLIEGEYSVAGVQLEFVPVSTPTEVGLDCGGGAQISGSSATTPLHAIAPPGYSFDPAALPGQLSLTASFVSQEGFDITVSQVFEP